MNDYDLLLWLSKQKNWLNRCSIYYKAGLTEHEYTWLESTLIANRLVDTYQEYIRINECGRFWLMGYETAKVTRWQPGNVVIHRADAKRHPGMLMVVLGYNKNGLCRTRYLDPAQGKKIYENHPQNLLDPFLFPALEVYLSHE